MPIKYRTLAQSNPAANTPTVIYTVPANTQTVVSTFQVCNQNVNAAAFFISTQVAGASLANSQYVAFNTTVPGYDSISFTIGMALGNTDTVTVQANTPNISFVMFGSEIT